MTWQELADKINDLSPEQKNMNVIYLSWDEQSKKFVEASDLYQLIVNNKGTPYMD